MGMEKIALTNPMKLNLVDSFGEELKRQYIELYYITNAV